MGKIISGWEALKLYGIYQLARGISNVLFDIRVEGFDNLEAVVKYPYRSVIFFGNHTSRVDTHAAGRFIYSALLQQDGIWHLKDVEEQFPRFVANRKLLDIPILGWITKQSPNFYITKSEEKNRSDLHKHPGEYMALLDHADLGRNLFMYPQAARKDEGDVETFGDMLSWLMYSTHDDPIMVPCYVSGATENIKENMSNPITATFGQPFTRGETPQGLVLGAEYFGTKDMSPPKKAMHRIRHSVLHKEVTKAVYLERCHSLTPIEEHRHLGELALAECEQRPELRDLYL
ncbi:MAG: 1-acyl-sn-glycerol-3-phosphate acyltransferase [archaeon]